MDKQSLETAVSDAWDDLGTAAVLVKMAAQDYVDAAQETLAAFDEVQRQLTTIFMQNLSLEQASQLMAELRKRPAGQMTVAFAHDTQLQVKLKSANDGKQAYRDAQLAWQHALDAAKAAACEPTDRFSAPDEIMDANKAIEAEAQITEKLNALRTAIEKGAQHVDTIVQGAQQRASVGPETTVQQAVPAAAPITESNVASEVEDPLAMLDGMTGDGAAPAAPPVPPSAPIVAPPVACASSQEATSESDSVAPMSDVARRMTAELIDRCLAVAEATVAFDEAPRSDLDTLVSKADAALNALRASLENYTEEIRNPDPEKVKEAEQLIQSGEHVVAHAQRLKAIGPLIDKALNESDVLQAAGEAYDNAQNTQARAVACGVYKQAVEALMATHAQLVASGMAQPDLLKNLGELLDQGGVNLATMANRAHVAAVSPQKDAHDLSWAPQVAHTSHRNLVRFAKPAAIGLAALVVVIAGVWIGSSGGESSAPSVVARVVAPAVALPPVPAPAATPVPVAAAPLPARSASSPPVVPPAPPPAPSPVTPPASAVAKPAAAPTVHRPPAVRHVDSLAHEQAQLNAANAKLDAWAKAQGVHP